MARRTIPFVPSVSYHLYNRGNNRQRIFFEDENYLYFIAGIRRYLLPVVEILAYCLMPTHYHLLVRVKPDASWQQSSDISGEVSKAMMRLAVSYTKAINKRFDRVGALFQGPFQSRPVKSTSYLLNLCRYIHANPVKDGLVADPADWPFSNYLEWIGARDGRLVDREFVTGQFGSSPNYRAFVLAYLRSRRLPDDVRIYLQGLET
ncbi:MAG: transposase [Chloroflexi bacterium]|nr:transposase [Chloroflexota bacterium]